MNTLIRFTKGFLKITWKIFKIVLYVVVAVVEAEGKSTPVCGPLEAYDRREKGEITYEEFENATKPD